MSYFNAGFSLFIAVLVVPLNILILVSIIKMHHLFHRTFYLIIANIALADVLSGIIVNTLSIIFHLKESMSIKTTEFEVSILHYTFFTLNSVSVLSMAFLSIDRLGVLLNPYYFYRIMTRVRTIAFLILAWFVSAGLSVIYFNVGYIRYLVVFSLTSVTLTMIIMVATMILFKRRLTESERADAIKQSPTPRGSIDVVVPQGKRKTALHNFTKMDKRVTTTFLWMLVLFIINYLPCVVITAYVNLCEDCSCTFVHVMRDIVFMSIIASGLLRAVNFIARLTMLRESVKSLLDCRKRRQVVEGFEFGLPQGVR
jgi:7 transmembrane receptor (rhodopsin family).